MKTTGNTILITGGGTGIGEALAHRFHDLGNTVIIAGRRLETLQKAIGDRPNVHALTLDMDDPANVAAFAERLVADFPAVNVLFNSAGIMRMEMSLDKVRDLSDAEASVNTNLLGPIRVTNALIEHLGRQPDAAIVNVSSGLAFVPLVIADQGRHPQLYRFAARGSEGQDRSHRTRSASRADGANPRPKDQ